MMATMARSIVAAHLHSACCDLVADVARSHGNVQLRVAGASMVPVLWPGDLLTVQSCDPAQLEAGSIIVFRQDGKLIAHRLMRRSGDCPVDSPPDCSTGYLITRGDARPRLDEPVDPADVVGRVESITRDGRPVDAQPSAWQRLAAAILRRSEGCTRLFLRLGPGIRKLGVGQASAEVL